MKPLSLTQITVPYAHAIRNLRIRDTYDWHQYIWKAFANRPDAKRDFLTRVDALDEGYRILILSSIQPQKPDWCPTDCFQTKAIPDSYFERQTYRFSLLANPTRKVTVKLPDGTFKKNGQRKSLTKQEELLAWLQRKAEAGGFTVQPDKVRIIPKGQESFFKEGHRGLHVAVEFQGELNVTTPEQFRSTIENGIGSAKAFGFGMLVVAPTQQHNKHTPNV